MIPRGKVNRLHYDVKQYFRAYFKELRKQIAAHDPNFEKVPHWFKGGRKVETIVCKDGAVVIHWPYDMETMTYPDKPDSFPLFHMPDELVKERVARYELLWPDPTTLPSGWSPLIPNYAPGEGFKPGHWPEPRRRLTPWENQDKDIVEHDKWTRLDYTPASRLEVWRDVERARRQARGILSRHIDLSG